MSKAVFLDRDGTINVEKSYLFKIEDFEFVPGVINGLKMLQDAGFLLIIITNQSGIARGYYTEDDFLILNNWMLNTLNKYDIHITNTYYCPHHPNAKVEKFRINCDCRKPKLALFQRAIRDFNLNLSQSYAIGDKIRDCAICESSDCKGVLIGENEKSNIIRGVKNGEFKGIKYASNFLDGVDYIINDSKQ